MPSLFERLPALRAWNRGLLLVALTSLVWTFDLAWDIMGAAFFPAQGTHPIPAEIEAHVIMHGLTWPILMLCYLAAVTASRRFKSPWIVSPMNILLGFTYAALMRPFIAIGVYLATGSYNGLGTHYDSWLEAFFPLHFWLMDVMYSVVVYTLGLFVILGVNARLDLEDERARTSQLYALWLNARLDTLRSQLNPHFLFNSLHTISSLLFTDTRRADKLLADFSDVLRITLREGQREFSTVREEMDYARHYLSIEETRFEDRLKVYFTVDEDSLGARVPSLILQPLIENAIKHGISNCAGTNAVNVEVRRGGDTLVMEVSNDFRADNSPVAPEKKMGIGLKNVRERLMAIYGADHSVSSLGLPGNRWSTRISFPYQEALVA